MAVIDNPIVGRANRDFAKTKDIDEFVEMLEKLETQQITPEEWRRFRLLRGTYGQRQDNVQMLRIKIPQGIVTGAQMRAMASVGARYSRGFGHVTTRQNVQFHFVPLKDVETALRQMADTGLTTRDACGNSVRTITGCSYAGTSATEIFDVIPYAEALTRYFLRHPLSGVLPRKFKICFEGCTEDHAFASINDIGWRARIVDGRKGFRVTVAGGTSILPVSGYVLYDFLPVEEMFEVAEAVVRVFHRFGDYEHRQRNRLKFVIKTIGWDGFKSRFDECLAEFRRDGGAPLNFDPAKTAVERAPDWVPASAPTLQGVVATAATPVSGPGIVPGTVTLTPLTDTYTRWLKSNVSLQKQPGYCHVIVRLPLGDFTSGQMRVLADLAEAYGDGTMRLTVDQNVLYRWVKTESVEPFYQRIAAAGLGAPDAGTLGDVVSCPGAESCRLAVTHSRSLGRVLTEFLAGRPDLVSAADGADIKISGCPNGCGQHHIATIGFQGSVRRLGGKAVPQYFLMLGGQVGDERADFGRVVAKIPVRRLTDAVERLVVHYRDTHVGDERAATFFQKMTIEDVKVVLGDLEGLTITTATAEDYVDLDQATEFNPEVMDGECSA